MEYRDRRDNRMPRDNRGQGMSKAARRRRRRRMKILQAVIPVAIAVILIVVILIVSISTGLFDSFAYSSDKADLNSYFRCTSMDEATVVKEGEITDERITVKNGHLYCPLEVVTQDYNQGFYWESFDSRLLYTTGDGVYSVSPENSYYSLGDAGNQTDYTIVYMDGETVMVCLDYVKLFTNFEYNLYGGGNEPYRVEIKNTWGSKTVADITKDEMAIRIDADKQAEILEEMREGATVVVDSSENEDWMKVTTQDLITGYIEKKYLSDVYEIVENPVTDVAPVVVSKVSDYSEPVVLAWHNVTNEDSSTYLKDYLNYLGYINTISPTWFALSDDEGTVASIASESYVSTCHEKGLKVWGLVDNMTYDVSTYTVMSDPAKRSKVISQLLSYASQYNLDGINVDFEMLTQDAGPGFVQFVRELCLEAHKVGLVISVDNYVPKDYSQHYNRYEQGVFADYVIIMGYDEHTSGSSEAGSVASIDYVLNGIEKTLEEVPANEVINAVPFYTRYWTVTDEGAILDMQTIPMSTAEQTISSAGVEKKWDDSTGQNYAQWTTGEGIKKIWMEDADSIRSKMEVMTTNNVGGVAVWQLAYSTQSAWEVINEYYKP